MKQIITLALCMVTVLSMAQKNQNENPASVQQAQQQVDEAKKAYQDALQKEQDLRAQLMAAENEIDNSRIALRKATQNMTAAQKEANPTVVERYEPMINPIYDEMSMGSQYGLSTFIEGTETSGLIDLFSGDVDKEFKAYLKQFKSGKIKKQKGELFFDNIIIPEMSSTTIDLYVDFKDQDNGVNILTYFDMGTGFLDTNQTDDRSVKYANRLMDNFARYIRNNILENDIKNDEKNLDKTFKDIEDKKNDIQESREDIHKLEADITESRNKLSELEATVDSLNERLERSRQKLGKVN